MVPSCCAHLSRGLSLGRSLGGDGSVVQLLDLALLAVLRALSVPSRCTRCFPYPLQTHLPLGEPELALATALGENALVFLEGSADDARCDRDVTVVAVRNCQLRRLRGRLERGGAYERPATFQADAIVMVGWGVDGVVGRFAVADGVGGVELKVADAARSCSSLARDRALTPT
jgi:hypothetical protein